MIKIDTSLLSQSTQQLSSLLSSFHELLSNSMNFKFFKNIHINQLVNRILFKNTMILYLDGIRETF
jgi:hypothetical protein